MLEEKIKYIIDRIIARRYEIAQKIGEQRWDEIVKANNGVPPIINIDITPEEVNDYRVKLIELYAQGVITDNEKALRQISKQARETGEVAVRLGASLEDGLAETKFYRSVIRNIVKEETVNANESLEIAFDIVGKTDELIDQAVHAYSLAYVTHHNKSIEMAKEALHELSVPVVPISEGIGVLPIIGAIDTLRAKYLMEVSLKRSTEMQLRYLIIDLSGVPIIDTMVAQELFKILSALKLLGVKAALAGIRPEIAQTMMNLGIEFKDVPTRASLQQALLSIGVRCEEIAPLK